ncbi:MAG: UDP-4-amino-4,6-dideoxy-N-acetyl-beta-L-altrosamine transaminase [Clostridiales Family XIII bacterium]|jgi:UDP-4-amino-4,6-dideoxy-N-acetyl-beta-L-altrosamine transaminase|nr:UDP-4-amino-4,6-dideoxy-N-acetyl-beta-L-altrosamine transaminase [Clostridiales Family XIII bacterium]
MMKIPYGRQTITDSDIAAVVDVLKSDYLTQGPKIPEFEKMVAAYHGAKYAVAFSNGTAALHAAYHALGVTDGDEIITSPITFSATANAAVYLGGKPVFADIDPATNCIDIDGIEERITPRTKVIAPVSFGGYPVDLKRVAALAKKHGVRVLHDAAHAIGSRRDGTFGMEYADIAILSFHPVKHIATGEGGMALTNDAAVYQSLQLFRSHGITKAPELLSENHGPWYYEMISLGYNYRITDIQAALGISQFARIGENLRARNKAAKYYTESLADYDGIELPPSLGFDSIENGGADTVHAYHLFTVRVADPRRRPDMYRYLHEHGVLAQVHYIPVHLLPYYKKRFGYAKGDFPEAEKFYEAELSIPMFHGISEAEREYVAGTIRAYG